MSNTTRPWLSTPLVAIIAVIAVAACTTTPVGPPANAPRLSLGDHWQYRITDGLRRGAVSQLDAEVTSSSGGMATVRLTYTDNSGRFEELKEIDATGGLQAGSLWREPPRRFTPPARLLAFPLEQGKTWRQTIDTFRNDTQLRDAIMIYGNVQGRSTVAVPAGTFDAIQVYRIVQLDDEQFWRSRTTRRDQVWYAPEVKGAVRVVRDAEYIEKGDRKDSAVVRTEYTTTELVSFRPGKQGA